MDRGDRAGNSSALLDVLVDVSGRYAFDHRRITISGCTLSDTTALTRQIQCVGLCPSTLIDQMGGRGAWSVVLNHTSPFAGMAAVAGELDSVQLKATASLKNVVKNRLPIRHLHGTKDTLSTQAQFDATTKAFANAAKLVHKTSQLISTTVQGLDHSAMQNSPPWDAALLQWLLAQSVCTCAMPG